MEGGSWRVEGAQGRECRMSGAVNHAPGHRAAFGEPPRFSGSKNDFFLGALTSPTPSLRRLCSLLSQYERPRYVSSCLLRHLGAGLLTPLPGAGAAAAAACSRTPMALSTSLTKYSHFVAQEKSFQLSCSPSDSLSESTTVPTLSTAGRLLLGCSGEGGLACSRASSCGGEAISPMAQDPPPSACRAPPDPERGELLCGLSLLPPVALGVAAAAAAGVAAGETAAVAAAPGATTACGVVPGSEKTADPSRSRPTTSCKLISSPSSTRSSIGLSRDTRPRPGRCTPWRRRRVPGGSGEGTTTEIIVSSSRVSTTLCSSFKTDTLCAGLLRALPSR